MKGEKAGHPWSCLVTPRHLQPDIQVSPPEQVTPVALHSPTPAILVTISPPEEHGAFLPLPSQGRVFLGSYLQSCLRVRKLTHQHLTGCKILRTEIMISFLQLWDTNKHKNDLYANLLSRQMARILS